MWRVFFGFFFFVWVWVVWVCIFEVDFKVVFFCVVVFWKEYFYVVEFNFFGLELLEVVDVYVEEFFCEVFSFGFLDWEYCYVVGFVFYFEIYVVEFFNFVFDGVELGVEFFEGVWIIDYYVGVIIYVEDEGFVFYGIFFVEDECVGFVYCGWFVYVVSSNVLEEF